MMINRAIWTLWFRIIAKPDIERDENSHAQTSTTFHHLTDQILVAHISGWVDDLRRGFRCRAQSRDGRILLSRGATFQRRTIQNREATTHRPSPPQLQSVRGTTAVDDLLRTRLHNERVYAASDRNRAGMAHGSRSSLLQDQRNRRQHQQENAQKHWKIQNGAAEWIVFC